MYQTIVSPAARKAHTTIGAEVGLKTTVHSTTPVLCLGALLNAATSVTSIATSASFNSAQTSDAAADDITNTEGTEVAASFATSALYLPPGRMTAPVRSVPSNASVDQLLSAVRAA